MNKKFCPKCGKEEGTFIGNFCKDCYLKDNAVAAVPEIIEVERCKRCGKIKWKGKFREYNQHFLKEIIESKAKLSQDIENPKISIELAELGEEEINSEITVNGILENSPFTINLSTKVKLKTVLCDPCMRMTSYYHEAILQLRYDRKPKEADRNTAIEQVEEVLKKYAKTDSLAAIVDVKEAAKGFDILIGSKNAAKAAADMLAKRNKSDIKRSFKLIGVDKTGKEKKRYTFCVRIT